MVAIYHVLESRKLSSVPADRAALERALCRLGPHGVLFPLKQRSVRMPAWPRPGEDPAKIMMTADGDAADNGDDSSVDMDGSDLPGGGDALLPAPAVVAWTVAGAPTDMPPSSFDVT